MPKRIFYQDDARARILAGVNALADAVAVTYGPLGGDVVIGHTYYDPTITHDGVTVANNIDLEDGDESQLGWKVGAELIKRAASNLNLIAGDGTSTVTILTRAILQEASRLIAAGNNPQEVKKGINKAGADVLAALEKLGEKIEADSPRVEQVATISAGDAEIGKLIADVIKKVGKEATLTVETHQGINIDSEITEGFAFDYGMTSPSFITDAAKREAVLEKAAVILYNGHINDSEELTPIINLILKTGTKQIVLIAGSMEKEVTRTLIEYKVNEMLQPVIIKAPATDEMRKTMLEDLAVFTGASVLTAGASADTSDVFTLENAQLAQVGRIEKAIIGQDKTVLIDGMGKTEAIDARVKEIKDKQYDSELDREIANRRAATLKGKVAVIKVGGATEPEIEERKYRVDDAVAAVRAALDEGIVAGGGITLVHLAQGIKPDYRATDAEKAGVTALKNALMQPFMQIMTNAGLRAESLLDKVIEENSLYTTPIRGIDIKNGSGMLNLLDAGVIDPKLVTKEVIKNSVSIAATAATMGALVVEVPAKSIANNA